MPYRSLKEMIKDAFNNEKLSRVIGKTRYYHLTSTGSITNARKYGKELHELGYYYAIFEKPKTKLYVVYVAR